MVDRTSTGIKLFSHIYFHQRAVLFVLPETLAVNTVISLPSVYPSAVSNCLSGHWALFYSQGDEMEKPSCCQAGKPDLTWALQQLPLWPSCWKTWHIERLSGKTVTAAPKIIIVVVGSTESFKGLFHSIFSHACYEIRNTFISLTFDT